MPRSASPDAKQAHKSAGLIGTRAMPENQRDSAAILFGGQIEQRRDGVGFVNLDGDGFWTY